MLPPVSSYTNTTVCFSYTYYSKISRVCRFTLFFIFCICLSRKIVEHDKKEILSILAERKLVFSYHVYVLAETRMHDCSSHIANEIYCVPSICKPAQSIYL